VPKEPSKKQSALSAKTSIQHYLNSKLGVLYIGMELDKRLSESGVSNVLVNVVHPGMCDANFLMLESIAMFRTNSLRYQAMLLGPILAILTSDP
jgi:hypothetical protein